VPRITLPLAAALGVTLALAGCRSRSEIVVFHAASLSRVLRDAAERFERAHPGYVVRTEPSGSQVAARKVAELGLPADLVAVADVRVLDELLVPTHAETWIGFATNELVLAHAEHSRFTEEITESSWPEVVTRPEVRLARVDPDLAPVGYQTLVAWRLADRLWAGTPRAGLAARLAARCGPGHVVSDEAELAALLEARAIDYAFLYRSTAEDHRLKIVALPPEVSLGDARLAGTYRAAEVEVRMRSGAPRVRMQGAPLLYGLAIPRAAPNAKGAALFAAFLLEEEGRAALRRGGFRAEAPAPSRDPERLPPALRGLCRRAAP
jgi:molybdate/tungstate transport system substrate-binding protein